MKKIISYILTLSIILSILNVSYTPATASSSKKIKVAFVDIGQGNATVIKYGKKITMIDTGKESEYSKLQGYLSNQNIDTIDNLIITHDDSDHMGAADYVIRDYGVKVITRAKFRTEKDTYEARELNEAITEYGVKVKNVNAGDKINIGSGVTALVLSPSELYSESNQQSIVIKMIYNQKSFMFTGDIDARIEGIVRQNYDVNVDVLQVAHHGSGYSSSIAWLNDTSPTYAVISVGANNSYGHPDPTVIKRLKRFVKKIYRTDINGSITFISDGQSLTVKTTGSSDVESGSGSNPTITPTPSPSSIPVKGKVIGNKNSKIYHRLTCHLLPYKKNRVYFKNVKKAKKAGYRACKICF